MAVYPEGADFALAEAERLTETDNKIAAARLLAATRAVLFLADDLIRGYNEYKKIHSKMDYEDLIVQTRELLENPGVADWVLYKLDGGIDNVLIDEAQDTSPDQWAIIRAITNEFLTGWVPRTKTVRYLPWVTVNSRFILFRGLIRRNLSVCAGILQKS